MCLNKTAVWKRSHLQLQKRQQNRRGGCWKRGREKIEKEETTSYRDNYEAALKGNLEGKKVDSTQNLYNLTSVWLSFNSATLYNILTRL